MWEKGKGWNTNGKQKHFAHDVEATLASLWSLGAQPLLFGVVGSYLDFRRMDGETILKAILTVAIGVTFRTIMAYCAMFKAGLSKREQLFVALSWLPKATVQAAFCSYPYDKIMSKPLADWCSDPSACTAGELKEMADYYQWAQDIMVTGGLAILMTAPIGLIIIQKLGPKWLEQDTSAGMEKSIEDMVAKELEEKQKNAGKASRPS